MVVNSVGPSFWIEWSNTEFDVQSTLLEHAPKHRVVVQPKGMLTQFKSHMAIAEVISSLE